jgi:preprotein translocase subunit YajC
MSNRLKNPGRGKLVENAAPFLILLGIALLFWLIAIRPAQRRQRALQHLQGGIGVGDEIMLTSGIFGVVTSLDQETVHLQIADGVTVRVVRAAVGRVVSPTSREDEGELAVSPADEPEEKQSDGTQ